MKREDREDHMDLIKQQNRELYHYGVKGMKWGVRKSEYKSMSRDQKKKTREEYKQDKKWKKSTFNRKNYYESWSKSVDKFNSELPELNKKLKGKSVEQMNSIYTKRMKELMESSISEVAKSTKSPTGRYAVEMFLQDLGSAPYMMLTDSMSDNVTIMREGS